MFALGQLSKSEKSVNYLVFLEGDTVVHLRAGNIDIIVF